jgi:hypothetical protein
MASHFQHAQCGISRFPVAPHESFIEHSGGLFIDVAFQDFDIARNSDVSCKLSWPSLKASIHGEVL